MCGPPGFGTPAPAPAPTPVAEVKPEERLAQLYEIHSPLRTAATSNTGATMGTTGNTGQGTTGFDRTKWTIGHKVPGGIKPYDGFLEHFDVFYVRLRDHYASVNPQYIVLLNLIEKTPEVISAGKSII